MKTNKYDSNAWLPCYHGILPENLILLIMRKDALTVISRY